MPGSPFQCTADFLPFHAPLLRLGNGYSISQVQNCFGAALTSQSVNGAFALVGTCCDGL